MPKVGDKVRYLGGDNDDINNLTIGKVYEIEDDGGLYFIDDDDFQWYLDEDYNDNLEYYELVTEPSQEVPDLIANLGRRLSAVESLLVPEDYAEVSADEIESDSEDAVNSPSHYKHGKFETIEVIEEITQGYDDGFVAHCAGTAIKYIARAPFKHDSPTEDLRKAAKYLEFAIERLEASE